MMLRLLVILPCLFLYGCCAQNDFSPNSNSPFPVSYTRTVTETKVTNPPSFSPVSMSPPTIYQAPPVYSPPIATYQSMPCAQPMQTFQAPPCPTYSGPPTYSSPPPCQPSYQAPSYQSNPCPPSYQSPSYQSNPCAPSYQANPCTYQSIQADPCHPSRYTVALPPSGSTNLTISLPQQVQGSYSEEKSVPKSIGISPGIIEKQ